MLKHKSSAVHISTLSNQPSTSARSQSVKPTLIQQSYSSGNENTPPPFPQLMEIHSLPPLFTLPPTRTRSSSTSSVKTIKSYGEATKDKKRPRESRDGGGRRTRQRTASSASTDTITGDDRDTDQPPSAIPFPSSTPTPTPPTQEESTNSKHSSSPKNQGKRNFSPPMSLLIPSRAAPSAPIVTPENVRKGAPAAQHSRVLSKGRSIHDSIPARFECFPRSQSQSWFEVETPTSPTYADQDVQISFYKRQPHFDVWDLDDDVCIGIPARIHISVPDIDEPEIRFIDITCQSYEHPFPHPYYLQAEPEYTVSFKGYHRTWTSGRETEVDLTKGIVVCPRWYNSSPPKRDLERILTSSRGVLPPDSSAISDDGFSGEAGDSGSAGGRYIKCLIPVPMRLITAGNARVFTVQVRAGRYYDGYGFEEVGRAETEMVVSHLRSECEMGMGRRTKQNICV